ITSIATAFGVPPTTYSSAGANHICPLHSCVVDADIEFNPGDTFSTAPAPPANDFDLQAIATHEIGHMIGLDHSGLANAVMFAFGDTGSVASRTLSVDDVLAAGSDYPSVNFAPTVGTLNGTVTLSSSGVFAAHVVVMDAVSGAAVTDGLTNSDGTYSIFVPPGSYQVIALPLQGVYNLGDFGGWACGYEENGPPCCDPASDSSCTAAALSPPTNYSGKFH
ncbi:MAG: matrixin family metalloprotease, partial [Terriglobia bacterium]